MNANTTNSKELMSVNNEHKDKIKKISKQLFIVLVLFVGIYFIGHVVGEKDQKNKTITEIQYTLSSDYGLDEWQILEMAIAKTESEFNQYAVGKTNDYGIFQITPIYVKDVNRISGKHYQLTDAFDIKKSLEMFSIMQKHYNSKYDINVAVNLHNPNGKCIKYSETVYSNIIFIKRMEEVRKNIILNKLYKSNNLRLKEIVNSDSKHMQDSEIVITDLSTKPIEKIKIGK